MRSASPGMAKAACDRKKAGILRELRLVCSSWKLGSNPASEGESPATWLRRASNWLRVGRRGKPTMCSPAGKRNLGEAAICTAAGEAGLSEDVPGLARFCLVLPSGTAAVPEVDRNTVSGAGRFGVSVVREAGPPLGGRAAIFGASPGLEGAAMASRVRRALRERAWPCPSRGWGLRGGSGGGPEPARARSGGGPPATPCAILAGPRLLECGAAPMAPEASRGRAGRER